MTNHQRKKVFTITFPKLVNYIQNQTLEVIKNDSDNLQGEGLKIVITSNIIDNYTRLEILLGLKFSGHNITLTEASN